MNEKKSEDDVVGVEHLVEAMLDRCHDSWADYGYLTRFIELVRQEFGLSSDQDSRAHYLDMVLDELSGSVLPLQGAMEVPREIAAGYHAANRGGAIDDLRNRLRAVQERFLYGFFRAWRPDIDACSTTMAELRRRGLPERRYFDVDDW